MPVAASSPASPRAAGEGQRSPSLLARVWAAVPAGRSLADADWERRHRVVLWVLWLHVAVLGVAAVSGRFGPGGPHGALEAALLALPAALASRAVLSRRLRAGFAALGLVASSATLVHLSGGYIEFHFHFFVVVALMAVYEDWIPFLAAVCFVLIHHGVVGAVDPNSVYNHPAARAHPWRWAGIHGLFVLALVIVCLAGWRALEAEYERRLVERRAADEAARAGESRFRLLFAANPHPMWVYDRATLAFLEVNDAAVAHYGYGRDEFLAMTILDLAPEEDLLRLQAGLAAERGALKASSGWRHRLKDGRLIDIETTSHLLDFGGRQAALVVAQDVTARLALEAELAHRAFHDPLTGLPNRALFLDRLAYVLDRRAPAAVLFVDLDDFKVVNDTLGHRDGDELLIGVATRLRASLRPGDMLARLGGDEFTLLLEGVAAEREAVVVAERVADVLRAPFRLAGRELFATPSVGIAFAGAAGARPDDLLRAADMAMYAAKRRGKARYAIFDAGMDERAWKRLELEAALRRAIDGGELRLHYQPLIDLTTGRVTDVEALVRWEQPGRGLMQPSDFIPLAEETGLIVPLGRWVLREACRQVRAWQRLGPGRRDLGVAVNLSARHFQDPHLVACVAAALSEAELAPACLELEITETAALEDIAGTAATLRELKALGVRLAIDDFGAGYSGLSYLRRCPVDALKIDRSYVAGLGRETGDEAMIRAVLAFARTMGLAVTAEGVETADQVAQLQELGCDLGQGFYFARPLPPDALPSLLAGPTPPVAAIRQLAALAG
jgi:diguanylate cyclase (GGDEF)-like protein/PAS domain S-box-containing protein